MSSLGGRRRERGKTLLSPGSGPRIIREPAIDRLTADRLAGVLSLLSSGQPEITESKVAESEAAASEFATHEFAKPDWAKPEQAESEWAKAASAFASPAPVISPADGWVPERFARENSVPELAAREALLPDLATPRHSMPERSAREVWRPEFAVPEHFVSAVAVPVVAGPGRHRRPDQKGRATKNVPKGARTVALVLRRVAGMSLVTLVAIAVGLGVLKAWG